MPSLPWPRRRHGRSRTVPAFAALAVSFSAVATGLAAPAADTPAAHVRSAAAVVGSARAAAPGWAKAFHTDEPTQIVGVTWAGAVPGAVEVRTRTAGGWSDWTELHGNPAEGPDPGTREDTGRTSAGPVWVGHGVHDFEVRVTDEAGPLHDLKVHAVHTTVGASPARAWGTPAAAAVPPVPGIHYRPEWGASADWQPSAGCSSPPYASTVRYAIVHHTDSTNTYSPADVPGMINGIWRYHVQANGWCDIGYNFLVDRFGGIWEGRAGGITRAVIGAHAGGYNSQSVGAAVLGSFTGAGIPAAAHDALATLLAWKLAHHGANPTGQITVRPGSFAQSRYPAGEPVLLWTILGHRDVNYTACPGDAGYAVVGSLRVDVQRRMAAAQDPGGSQGYWMVADDGGIFGFGGAPFLGSMGGTPLNRPVVGMAALPGGNGYWLVASDGGIFAFGDAPFHGSMGGTPLNAPIVGMAPTPDGGGYWLVASDGGIFAFGNAPFHGSMGGTRLNRPVVTMASNRSTGGYWLVASDGGVFSFNAPFYGSTGSIALAQPIVGMAPSAGGSGYRMVAADGGIFSFGDAPFMGSAAGGVRTAPVAAMTSTADGAGYRMAGRDGMAYSFGSARFFGSAAHVPLSRPVVGVAELLPR